MSFVFSGIEAGILSVNRVRLKHRLKHRDKSAIILNRLLEHPERLLVTVLLVTNLMNIFAMTLATQQFAIYFGNAGYFAALVLFLPVYLHRARTPAEIALPPLSLSCACRHQRPAAHRRPAALAVSLRRVPPFAAARRRPRRRNSAKLFVAREDFKYLTIESERQGALGKDERQMIHNVVDFRAIKAADVMLPLANVQTISSNAPIEELSSTASRHAAEYRPLADDQRLRRNRRPR